MSACREIAVSQFILLTIRANIDNKSNDKCSCNLHFLLLNVIMMRNVLLQPSQITTVYP